MQFLSFVVLAALTLAHTAHGATLLDKRQQVVSAHGTTTEPVDGSTITPGSTFPFHYSDVNFCESGYSPIHIYLSTSAPTAVDVTTSGGLVDGSFDFDFGNFLIPNFGLPAMSMPPPPPGTLSAPTLDGVADGTELFLTVVETFLSCPPDGHTEFGFETTTVTYA
ncbi:hypothetical protein L227DRAFT_612910 [Lentinus tigrinus ALCF2SS1-6]|uniref:Phosphatidylglycerol/phosphatidylinositol transfer protein n=1 Tax=Lentinus tigrinus ALCF2SS1-6 TaxID=1328759 RepID=A0A5C2S5L1_9APHY|nr:hypothetical protein L227DRAFT_612910 [Lentinus tigrinus ALCF2SS1-6]